jgi:hypothetical protein
MKFELSVFLFRFPIAISFYLSHQLLLFCSNCSVWKMLGNVLGGGGGGKNGLCGFLGGRGKFARRVRQNLGCVFIW